MPLKQLKGYTIISDSSAVTIVGVSLITLIIAVYIITIIQIAGYPGVRGSPVPRNIDPLGAAEGGIHQESGYTVVTFAAM